MKNYVGKVVSTLLNAVFQLLQRDGSENRPSHESSSHYRLQPPFNWDCLLQFVQFARFVKEYTRFHKVSICVGVSYPHTDFVVEGTSIFLCEFINVRVYYIYVYYVSVWVDIEGYAMSPKRKITNPGNISILRIKTWSTQQKTGWVYHKGVFVCKIFQINN